MTRIEARQIDKSYYILYDETNGHYGVYGAESEHCYTNHSTKDAAIDRADRMNEDIERTVMDQSYIGG